MNVLKDINNYYEITVVDQVGDFVSGLTINYEIKKSLDNSLIISGTTNEIQSVYYFDYTFTETGNFRLKYITPENYDNGFEQIIVTEDFISNINVINSGITNIESGITNIDNNIINIDSGITNINDDIISINSGITNINNNVINIDSGITNINDDIISINSGITNINTNIISINTNISEHRIETENRIKYILGLSQQNFKIIDQVYNPDNLLLTSTIIIYPTSTDLINNTNILKTYSMSATYDVDGKITSYQVIEL